MIRIEIEYKQFDDEPWHIKMDMITGADTVKVERVVAQLLQDHFVTVSKSAGMAVKITEEI